MTEPERRYRSTLGFSRRIIRRYLTAAPDAGLSRPDGEPFAPMEFVRRPALQVSALRPPGVAMRIMERAVEPALPTAAGTVRAAATSTDIPAVAGNEEEQWPEGSTRISVEPLSPFVPATPEPPPQRTPGPADAPVRRAFTVDEVRRALQRPATDASPMPARREERQPAPGEGTTPSGLQDGQTEVAAAARPRPVSRLYEQPQQPASSDQPAPVNATPAPAVALATDSEPEAGTVSPGAAASTGARPVTPPSGAPIAAPLDRRQNAPGADRSARRSMANRAESSEPAPVDASSADNRLYRIAAEQPQPATGYITEPADLQEPGETEGQPYTRPASPGSEPVAAPAVEGALRTPALGVATPISPPVAPGDGGPARRPFVPEPPSEGQAPVPEGAQPDGEVTVRPPAMTLTKPSEFGPATSEGPVEPFQSVTRTSEPTIQELPGSAVGRDNIPEGTPADLRRTLMPGGTDAAPPRAAAVPSPRATPATTDAPGGRPDLASAYRAQLARFAAETQAPPETGEPSFTPEQTEAAGEPVTTRLPGERMVRIEPPTGSASAINARTGTGVTPPPVAGSVRRETRTTANGPFTDAETQLPPATYDSTHPLQQQMVRLDQAPGVLGPPAALASQPSLPVRRTVTQGDTSRAGSATEAAPEAAGQSQAPAAAAPDIDELAEKVFVKLRSRLRVERERLGGARLR